MAFNTESKIRIMLVDDHGIILDSLSCLINDVPGFEVVATASTGEAAVRLAAFHKPDVVVMDLLLGEESGLSLILPLLQSTPSVRIVILTGVTDRRMRDKAVELGARGVVLKQKGAAELLKAIEKVFRTEDYWLEPGAVRRLFDKQRESTAEPPLDIEKSKLESLTPNERQLIELVGEGLDNRQIAARMHLAESTIRNSLSRIYEKLDIKGGRLALLVYAYRNRLLAAPS